jgi:hypothetical protein
VLGAGVQVSTKERCGPRCFGLVVVRHKTAVSFL